MRITFHLLACASFLAASCTAPRLSGPVAQSSEADIPASIRRLTSKEIAHLVVGYRIQNAQKRQRYSGEIIVTSAQWLDLRVDGTATFRADLWAKDGRYYLADDSLCVVLPRSDRLTSDMRRVRVPGEDVDCHMFYIDDAKTPYISGPLMGNDGLAAIDTTRL